MIRTFPFRAALLGVVLVGSLSVGSATETERVYLSGRGKDDAVPWKFMCTTGALSGFWTNLPVPSNWDVLGFGHLTYKKDYSNSITECGLYEKDFSASADWKDKRVFLVFEGAMTDTAAKLNGQSVGPTNQGGFYHFKYEVTDKLKPGAENKLEVTVAKHSANKSVNKAERLADYWVFGGIYRPVYLEIVPPQFIERVAIDARADGAFAMEVFLNGVTDADVVEAQIMTLAGETVGQTFLSASSGDFPVARSGNTGQESPVNRQAGKPALHLTTRITSPKLWTAETPNLYRVEVRLKRGAEVLHTFTQRFGFRTFEVRDGDGLYLNGQKIILKGVNRHSFWPDSGRCLSTAVHKLDIETIKDMNGNAVRMSHYPPDAEFLDLCDELGLYVLNELAGWHNAYDTNIGTKLVAQMVTRDVNHPSILLWDNGNEGGSNPGLDRVFHEFDPQKRRVLHPWGLHSGLNTAHYLMFANAEAAARGEPMYYNHKKRKELLDPKLPGGWIYMPTEFMHGLYDGGAGAGLADYWSMMMNHTNCAGGFIWAFVDEAVRRPVTNKLDTAGNQAPDGIVGPYREREMSFYTIKDIWTPIQAQLEPEGVLAVTNLFHFTDASQCKFTWQLRKFAPLHETGAGFTVLAEGNLTLPSIPPDKSHRVKLDLPQSAAQADALALRVNDPTGREVRTWVWPLNAPQVHYRASTNSGVARGFTAQNQGRELVVQGGDFKVTFSRNTGLLTGVERGGQKFSLRDGPRPALGQMVRLFKLTAEPEGADLVVEAKYLGEMRSAGWRVRADGWLDCEYRYRLDARPNFLSGRARDLAGASFPPPHSPEDFFGVTFDYPEKSVRAKRWLGNGPGRVWKNRREGGTLNVWTNDYNNTITGHSGWQYPEFKGCFSDVRWLQLETTEGLITVVPENVPFVQVLTPDQPPAKLVAKTKVNLPQCGLGFLDAIPPIGTKFKPASASGPQSQPNVGQDEYSGRVSFYFGKLP